MNACACGCGETTRFTWKRGHSNRAEHQRERMSRLIRAWNTSDDGRVTNAITNQRRAIDNPKTKASRSPSTHDIAWAAGIYEGEGTCGAHRTSSRSVRFHASVSQKNPEILLRLKALFGGGVYQFRSGAKRTVMHNWQVNRARALGFLFTIYPFLSQRRREQFRAAREKYLGH